jgi:CheY-like chemotaxis protein
MSAILIVDDFADTAASWQDLFQLHGHDTRTATSTTQALARLDGWVPDVALLDLSMPGADGFELARLLRASAPRLVLIAVTGFSSDEYREQARAAGFDHFFVKPADPDALVRLLETDAKCR